MHFLKEKNVNLNFDAISLYTICGLCHVLARSAEADRNQQKHVRNGL